MSCKKNSFWKVIALVLAIVMAMPGFTAFADETAASVSIIYGDVNADKVISAEDALVVLKVAAKLETISEEEKVVADVNNDKVIDASDALIILQYAAIIIDKFPVEEDEIPVTTDVSATNVPATEVPATEVPATEVPATEVPATEIPTTEVPVTEIPATETPAPTEGPVVIENAFAINVKDAGSVADVDGAKVTFKEADASGNGVRLENPFIGKDTTTGAAISFFMTSPVDIKPMSYTYTSIISIVNAEHTQVLKYDMEGTRQLATNPTPKLNHWAAELNINQGKEYFITLVANSDGLHYYINGINIGRGEYGQIDENMGRSNAMAIFSKAGSELYLGGTVNVPADFTDMCKNKVPAGTVVRDIVGYVGQVTDDDVKAWYEAYLEGNVVVPTPDPDEVPTEAPEVTATPEVVETPVPTPEVPAEPVVSMEVKATNDAATVEDGVITFVETTSTNGVLMNNPFANKILDGGGSISFWYTPVADTNNAALITLVNYKDLLQFARFNGDGTMQFRDAYSTQIYNVWSVDTKLEAGTSYFMTAVMSDDGLKYYANGEPIVITATDGNPGLKNEQKIKDTMLDLITNPNTDFYLGGTTNIWEKMQSGATHALPAGVVIKNVQAHMSALQPEDVKALYEEAIKEPEVEETPAPAEDLITLEVKDETYGSFWSIDTDLQVGDLVFGDRDRTFVAIDESLIGSQYIVTSCDSKKTTTDLAVVTANKDIVLSVGFDARVAEIPAWAADFTKTEITCTNNADVVFLIYQKEVKAGESVTLGAQGQSSGVVGYVAMATAK